jgi:hypothetical protein
MLLHPSRRVIGPVCATPTKPQATQPINATKIFKLESVFIFEVLIVIHLHSNDIPAMQSAPFSPC